ncbi:MAG: biotin/lipoyl-binding protein [Planctomycetes bacterium]|nr:biotin/lipoyl-binding protein [Planctomycetota bacterium]
MRWVVTHNDKELVLDAELRADGRYTVRHDEREWVVDLRSAGGASLWSVLLGTESYEAAVVRHEADVLVTLRARQLSLRVESEQARNARLLEGGGERVGPHTLKSVMPGRVTRILVREGEEVASGSPLLILEAMKMENEIRCSSAGVVQKIHVREGVAVAQGDALVTIA